MKFLKMLIFGIALCFMTALGLFASETLTNEAVIGMVKSGVEAELIISKIKSSQNQFDLTVEGILKLKNEGVSEEIIKAMIMGTEKKQMPAQEANDADYQKALNLMQEEKYDEAINILSPLASGNPDFKYHFSYVDALLEKSRVMKESADRGWESAAKEAQTRIKNLYRGNYTNSDYWVLYVKFGALIDKEMEVAGGFKKIFYYKPGNVDALILQGDLYSGLAQRSREMMTVDRELNNVRNDREERGKIARIAYKSALASAELPGDRKAEVYCKIGDLELQVFKNRTEAVNFWNQAVSAQPNGKWAAMAQERLSKIK